MNPPRLCAVVLTVTVGFRTRRDNADKIGILAAIRFDPGAAVKAEAHIFGNNVSDPVDVAEFESLLDRENIPFLRNAVGERSARGIFEVYAHLCPVAVKNARDRLRSAARIGDIFVHARIAIEVHALRAEIRRVRSDVHAHRESVIFESRSLRLRIGEIRGNVGQFGTLDPLRSVKNVGNIFLQRFRFEDAEPCFDGQDAADGDLPVVDVRARIIFLADEEACDPAVQHTRATFPFRSGR